MCVDSVVVVVVTVFVVVVVFYLLLYFLTWNSLLFSAESKEVVAEGPILRFAAQSFRGKCDTIFGCYVRSSYSRCRAKTAKMEDRFFIS